MTHSARLPHRAALVGAALLALAGCATSRETAQQPAVPQRPDATVTMTQVQAAFIGSGGGGHGTLHFRGHDYPFTVGGLGIGGIGAAKMEATGDVYGLTSVAQFPGAYVQGRYGYAFGDKSNGSLWLRNDKGVTMRLKAKRVGLMLSLGGDAVVIHMEK